MNQSKFKKTFVLLNFCFSLVITIWNYFYIMLITSDIPINYTNEELISAYIYSVIMFLSWYILIRISNETKIILFVYISFALFYIIDFISTLNIYSHNNKLFNFHLFYLDIINILFLLINFIFLYRKTRFINKNE
ncbi:MAG: hypothetical protein ACTHY0_03970 [Mammaliicoccus vitulinus]